MKRKTIIYVVLLAILVLVGNRINDKQKALELDNNNKATEIHELMNNQDSLNESLNKKEVELEKNKDTIKQKNDTIKQKQEVLDNQNDTIEQLRVELQAKKDREAEERALAQSNQATLASTTATRDTSQVSQASSTRATQPAPTPASTTGAGQAYGDGCNLVYNYSNWNQQTAYAVCMAESGGRAWAVNPEAHSNCNGSYGLFQIACVHGAGATTDGPANVAYANQLYASQGWSPWGAYTNGSFAKYL